MWKPKDGEKYWFFDGYGQEWEAVWDNHWVDENHFYFYNYFKTKKEARAAVEKVRDLLHRIKDGNDDPLQDFEFQIGQDGLKIIRKKSNHSTPPHYQMTPEPLEVIQAWDLNFAKGSALKYIARAGKKTGEDEVTALRKAVDFLQREIKRLEAME